MGHITDEKKLIRSYGEKYKEKLSKIKVLAFDIDGILTDGKIFYDGNHLEPNRNFHALDGHGMKMMMELGFVVGVVSGGRGLSLNKRFRDILKLNFVFLGNEDKRDAYKEILKMGYKDEEILFMGDDFIDYPILKRVGFSVTVPSASYEIQEAVDYITHREAGDGAAREVMDLVRYARGMKAPTFEF